MRVTYGGIQLGETNAARFTWARTLLRNKAGIGYGFEYAINFSEILIRSTSQSDCRFKMSLAGAALAAQEGDLIVWNDDNTPSDNAALSGSTLSGIRCTGGPIWLDKPGAQFLTHRLFACSFSWETAFAGTSFFLMEFKEQLTITGGTPLIVVLEPVNALPIAQITVPYQGWHAVQSGMAVGYRARPIASQIAPPVFPLALTKATVTQMSGERVGVNAKNFGVQWSYEFASATPLGGSPNEWVP